MQRTSITLAFVLLLTPAAARAEPPMPADHSTVHIVFVLPNNTPPQFDLNAPSARVGDIIIPVELVRPISISIDGDFVGHAMVGLHDVKPLFALPRGRHEFKFTCDGYESASIGVKVLGSGSKQYLVVKMKPELPSKNDTPANNPPASPATKSTRQSPGLPDDAG